jgi:hypothetical protein
VNRWLGAVADVYRTIGRDGVGDLIGLGLGGITGLADREWLGREALRRLHGCCCAGGGGRGRGAVAVRCPRFRRALL